MTHEDKLIQKMNQGDRDAVDELMAMYYPDILRYCLWHAPNRPLAEDITQETFLKAVRYFNHHAHKGSLKPFLYQIAKNTCIDMYRKNKLSDMPLDDMAVDIPYQEPGFDEIGADMALRQLIDSLSAPAQEILLLRFGHDLTIREIGEILNLPHRTVQSRLRAALKKIKRDLEQQEGGTS